MKISTIFTNYPSGARKEERDGYKGEYVCVASYVSLLDPELKSYHL